MSKSSRGY